MTESLSVVIPCRDDPRLARCVDSIDAGVEIVIVLNGSPPGFGADLEAEIGGRARIESLARAHMPRALEHGIAVARSDRVVLMDSDCVFEPGALAALARAFERGDPANEVYKGRIVFDAGPGRAGTIVARSRNQRWSNIKGLYKPPLAFDRRIAARLGGVLFEPHHIWKVDAVFGHRIREAGLSVATVDDCVVHHAPLSLRTDLRSSFRYGLGAAIAEHRGLRLPPPQRSVWAALRRDGVACAVYMVVANQCRKAGYAYAQGRIRLSGGRWLESLAG